MPLFHTIANLNSSSYLQTRLSASTINRARTSHTTVSACANSREQTRSSSRVSLIVVAEEETSVPRVEIKIADGTAGFCRLTVHPWANSSVASVQFNDHFADEAADKAHGWRARPARRSKSQLREMHAPPLFVTCTRRSIRTVYGDCV